MLKTIIICLLLSADCILSAKHRFDNYSVTKVFPKTENDFLILQDLQDKALDLDFWTDVTPNAESVDIMAHPTPAFELEKLLKFNNITYQITINDLQKLIDKETVKSYSRSNLRSMTWDAYYTLEDIEAWMRDIAAAYPDIVTDITVGHTYEGRPIKGLKISHGPGKKVIMIEAGIHSREWVVMSSACFIINELLTSIDEETMAAARDFDWYIMPVTNPDGYVWTHTDFRMWRKNRRPFATGVGVDLNRNWNNNWLVAGASSNPASDTYAGPGPFSEPETRSMSTWIRSIPDIQMYLSVHSFSQLLLIPFGNSTEPYGNYQEAVSIGRRAMGALSARYGTQYVTGNIAEAIYQATGGSVDWVKEQLKVPLVYCYELRDRGQNGFLLPTDQILPNNLEVMDSLIELVHQGKRFGLLNGSSTIQVSLFSLSLVLALIALVL